MTITDHDIIDAMTKLGGNFAKALAAAWRAGDADNRQRIKRSFPQLWDRYNLIAGVLRDQKEGA